MANEHVSVDELADAVMSALKDYTDVVIEDMKTAVKDAAKTVKAEISQNAPVKSGKYAKSWATKETKQNSHELEVTVHSRNRYQLAHLLEKGHAKRNGGRVPAKVHIAPAEEKGIQQLEKEIERSIRNG